MKMSWLLISLGLFGLVLVVDSSLAFGRSVGPLWLAGLATMITISVIASELLWSILKERFYPQASEFLSASTVAVAAAALSAGFYLALDKDFNIGRDLNSAKIEYFCVDHFKSKKCIQLVTQHPEAALEVPKWKRNQAVGNLKALDQASRPK